MWQYQDSLPRFPLPKLEDTLDRFKVALEPVVSAEQYSAYESAIEEFRTTSGPAIHAQLENLEKKATYNWMEGYWQSMYEKLRCPLPINVSPYLVLGPDPNPVQDKSQILKAASHLAATARFVTKLRAEEITADGAPDSPMCMFQFTRLLGTTRIPASGRDYLRVDSVSKHVIVMSMNHMYKLDILDDAGKPIEGQKVAEELAAIKKHSRSLRYSQGDLFPLGILTTEDRDTWARVRAELVSDSTNAASLDEVEKGILVVCLEDQSVKDPADLHKISLYGNGNRFFDKCLQLIVTEDGQAAYNLEHTPVDGQTLFRFIFDTYNDATSSTIAAAEPDLSSSSLPSVAPLPFNFSSSVQKAISNALHNYNQFVSAVDIAALDFQDFGKREIKKFGVSPDAFVQFAAQLAQYRTSGKLVSTYESSSTKHFSHGRTETIRSLTKEMRNAVLTFENPSASASEKMDAIRKASQRHAEVAKASKIGQGVDRHLQGLYWTAQQMLEREADFSLPQFFQNPAYGEYMSNKLSTSNVGGGFDGVKSFGFGAVHAEGVGLGYMINDDSLPLTLTSYTGVADKWTKNVEQALRDARALFSS